MIIITGEWFVILVIVVMVFQYVWNFIVWYIDREVRVLGFKNIIITFMGIMMLFLVRLDMVYLIRWEGIGMISYLLIRFWARSEASGSAIAAVMYNRMGDIGLICLLIITDDKMVWMFLIIAVLRKSALWVCGYWLPIAIEGPTPVSSLLHSSTIVVAGVVLRIMWFEGTLVIGLISLIVMSLILPSWYDRKKMIALSTSVHLSVMICILGLRIWGLVIIHIVTHGLIKASAFVNCRHVLHEYRSQDRRMWRTNMNVMVIVWSFFILCRVGRSVVMLTKEQIVMIVVRILIVAIGWNYTKNFTNISDGINKNVVISNFWYLLIFIRGSSWVRVDPLLMIVLVVGMNALSFNAIRVVNS